MNTIKAILIQPLLKTVELIDMPLDFDAMKRDYIKCDLAEVLDLGEGVDAWFDEEGMLKNWDEQGFTKIVNLTLAGNIILCGRTDDRRMDSLPDAIPVELVREMAVFIEPKRVRVPGTKITTIADDGTRTTENIGPETLTYDDH